MTRLFVALKIPEEITENLLIQCKQIAQHPGDYRWENPGKIHLTLKFIGEIGDNLVNPISEELNFLEYNHSQELTITKFGFFFKDRIPRILWAGLQTDESIYNLVEELNRRLSIFSIPIEKRKFKPHLTLLRIKNHPGEMFINKFNNYKLPDMKFISNEIVLMKSELFQTGARYTAIKKYILK